MFDDTYRTIKGPAEGLYKEKGSKFLAFAFPVRSTDEVKQHLEALRKSTSMPGTIVMPISWDPRRTFTE